MIKRRLMRVDIKPVRAVAEAHVFKRPMRECGEGRRAATMYIKFKKEITQPLDSAATVGRLSRLRGHKARPEPAH